MKVKELIEKLQEFDGDLEMFYDDAEYWPREVNNMNIEVVYKTEHGYRYTRYDKWDEVINCVLIE